MAKLQMQSELVLRSWTQQIILVRLPRLLKEGASKTVALV